MPPHCPSVSPVIKYNYYITDSYILSLIVMKVKVSHMRYRCLACGHDFEDRSDTPRNQRQCSKCGRRRAVEMQQYQAAIEKVKEFRRVNPGLKVSRQALASLLEALEPASPQASLNRLLRGELGEALADPFIAIRTGLQIWQQAGEELERRQGDS